MGKRTEKFKQARLDTIKNLTNELVADKQAIAELAELQKEALAEFTNKTNDIMNRCDRLSQALTDKIQKLEDEAKSITNEPLTEEHFEGEYNTLRKQVEDAYASVRMFQAPVEKDNETKSITGEATANTGKEETKVESVTTPIVETPIETKTEPVTTPVIETPIETKTEPVTTPVVETKIEPVVETKIEPITTPVDETKIEPVTTSVVETPTETKVESVVETPAEPVATPIDNNGPELITEESFTIDDDSLYEDILTDGTSSVVEPLTENSTTVEEEGTKPEDVITVVESTPVDNKPDPSPDVPASFADLLSRASNLNI